MSSFFSDIEWINLTTEAVFSAFFDMLILGIFALYIIWKNKKALKAGRFDDMVLFSFNVIDHHPETKAPILGFRTPLTGSLTEIFHSESLIKQIKAAAKQTTDQDPIVRLSNQKMHNIMQRHLINFSNRLNVAGQMATLTGQATQDKEYRLALIYEPSAQAKLFRIVPISKELIEKIEQLGDQLTFVLPYHADRLVVLKKIQQELDKDHHKEAQNQILAPMILSAPLYQATTQSSKDM